MPGEPLYPSDEPALAPAATDEIFEEPAEQTGSKIGPILYEIVETLLLAVVIWLAVNFSCFS